MPQGLERNNLGNSDPKCVADLVGLIFTKPQAQQGYGEDFGDVKPTKGVIQFGNGKAKLFLSRPLRGAVREFRALIRIRDIKGPLKNGNEPRAENEMPVKYFNFYTKKIKIFTFDQELLDICFGNIE